jgi:predicted ATPase
MEEAISLAKELNEANSLAVALHLAAFLARYERNPAEVERLSSDLIELSTVQNFAFWLASGEVSRGWARSASGDPDQGIASIDNGLRDYRATGSILITPCWLVLKAEALHLANRTSDALAALAEAEVVAQKTEERECLAELHRLRGVFLAAIGADEIKIEGSFCEAIRIAKKQKSVSLATRAEASYAEYRLKKASGLRGHGFPLPLC